MTSAKKINWKLLPIKQNLKPDFLSKEELEECLGICNKQNIPHKVISHYYIDLIDDSILSNEKIYIPSDYILKKEQERSFLQ